MDYQDLNFKSYYEKTTNKLSTNRDDNKFKESFIKIYDNQRISDVKSYMMLSKEEEFKFDFIFQNKEYVDKDFFENIKIFDEKLPNNEKVIILMDFLKKNYGVITPIVLKKAFEFFLGKEKPAPSIKDCESMLYLFFEKYQINLSDDYDRKNFLKFFEELNEKEKNALQKLKSKNSINESNNMIFLK